MEAWSRPSMAEERERRGSPGKVCIMQKASNVGAEGSIGVKFDLKVLFIYLCQGIWLGE